MMKSSDFIIPGWRFPPDRIIASKTHRLQAVVCSRFYGGMHVKKSEFHFDLPPELIAQHPLSRRDGSRLMVLDRQSGEIATGIFMT